MMIGRFIAGLACSVFLCSAASAAQVGLLCTIDNVQHPSHISIDIPNALMPGQYFMKNEGDEKDQMAGQAMEASSMATREEFFQLTMPGKPVEMLISRQTGNMAVRSPNGQQRKIGTCKLDKFREIPAGSAGGRKF